MRYEEPQPIERSDAERAFASGDPAHITDALVRATHSDPDWMWLQKQCVRFLSSDSAEVRGLAATCLGHIARIHGRLDLDTVIPLLTRAKSDPVTGGRAEDALDDISTFIMDRRLP